MDNRDRQIALLNINTAAAQIAVAVGGEGVLAFLDSYDAAFEHLQKQVFNAIDGGVIAPHRVLAGIERTFPDSEWVDAPEAPAPVQASAPMSRPTPNNGSFTVRVLGTQHGELPSWLIEACERAGISSIFDNRKDKDGNDMTGTKRPWFKEAVPKGETRDAVPFWPPKGR